MSIAKIATQLRQHLQDPLYRNSYFLMGRSVANSLLGVVFWIVAARLYPADQVGLATALISAIGLLVILSNLGLNISLLRYLPRETYKKGMINTAFTIRGLFASLLALVFVAGLGFWSPALQFVQEDIALLLLFVIFTTANSLTMLQSAAFVGMRSAKFSFVQSIIAGILRIPLPIVLLSLGVAGIFFAWGSAVCVALIAALFLFLPRVVPGYYPVPTIKRKVIKEIANFSAGNYAAEILESLPSLLLPLVIVNILAHEMSAYFYMAWGIALMLFMIPNSINSSLLAEGSYDPVGLRKNVIRAIKVTFILLVPAILIVLILGDKLLLLFGSEYSQNALYLLWILAASAIPVTITRVYMTIKRIQMKMGPVIAIYVFTASGTLALSCGLMTSIGLLGIGIAWISTQGIMAVVTGLLLIKEIKAGLADGREQ